MQNAAGFNIKGVLPPVEINGATVESNEFSEEASGTTAFTVVAKPHMAKTSSKIQKSSSLQQTPLVHLDTGANRSVTGDKSILFDLRPIDRLAVQVADGRFVSATFCGDIRLIGPRGQFATVKGVLFIPGATTSLLSLVGLVKDGARVEFTREECRIIAGNLIYTGKRTANGLWAMAVHTSQQSSTIPPIANSIVKKATATSSTLKISSPVRSTPPNSSSPATSLSLKLSDITTPTSHADTSLWHRRFAHVNPSLLLRIIKIYGLEDLVVKREGGSKQSGVNKVGEVVELEQNGIDIIRTQYGLDFCSSCLLGKQSDAVMPNGPGSETLMILGRVHTDVMVVNVTTDGGRKYAVTFMDEFSRHVKVYLISKKSEVFNCFKLYRAWAELYTGQKLRCLRSDRGGEYTSHEFRDYCEEYGIERELPPSYTPQQNGKAERINRTLMSKARTALTDAGIKNSLWGEALLWAVMMYNITPHSGINFDIPRSRFSAVANPRSLIDPRNLRPFGCAAYYRVPDELRKKLDPKSRQGIMVGYEPLSKSYRILLPNGKIHVTRNVRFNENFYPNRRPINFGAPALTSTIEVTNLDGDVERDAVDEDKDGVDEVQNIGEDNDDDELWFDAPAGPLIDRDDDLGELPDADGIGPGPQLVGTDIDDEEVDDEEETAVDTGSSSGSDYAPSSTPSDSDSEEIGSRAYNDYIERDELLNLESPPFSGGESSDELALGFATSELVRTNPLLNRIRVEEEECHFNIYLQNEKDNPVVLYASTTKDSNPDSPTYKEAMAGAYWESEWQPARDAEYAKFVEHEIADVVPRPKDGSLVIKGRWLLTTKRDEDKRVIKRKMRWVAKGYTQVEGKHFVDTFANVARTESLRVVLAKAAHNGDHIHQFDVESAFLYGDIDIDGLLVTIPDGYGNGRNDVWRLKKSLYGLKQSPRCWAKTFNEFLTGINFFKSKADECLYVYKKGGDYIYLIVHVDDGLLVSNSLETLDWFKKELLSRFKSKYETNPRFFLGCNIDRLPNGCIALSQRTAISNAITTYSNDLSTKYPTVPISPLTNLTAATDEEFLLASSLPYRALLGVLMWFAVGTRLDIAQAIGELGRSTERWSTRHYFALQHVLQYLAGTMDYRLLYRHNTSHGMVPQVFVDANWAGDVETRRSTSGYVILIAGAAVSWASRRQPTVASSTTEAEYMAVSEVIKQVIWTRRLVGDLGFKIDEATVIQCDNRGAVFLCANATDHKRMKHIDIKHHFIREKIETGEAKMKLIMTGENCSDFLTKLLYKPSHFFCVQAVGLVEG